MRTAILGLVFMLLLGSSTAMANLIINGGFETGDLTGWTLAPSDSNIWVFSNDPHSGTYDANFKGFHGYWDSGKGVWVYTYDAIVQPVSTVAGQGYAVDFWLEHTGLDNSSFQVQWNSDTIYNTSNSGFDYIEVTENVVGSGSDAITFREYGFSATYILDDVTVEKSVPEPASLVLLGTGFAGICLAAWRRKR